MKKMNEDINLILTHFDEECEKYLGAVVPPVFFNSLYVSESMDEFLKVDNSERYSFVYGRNDNPTTSIVENKLAVLEKGNEALLFSAGMAATTAAIMATCRAGSHIICMSNAYGPVRQYLENVCCGQLNIHISFVKGDDVDEIAEKITSQTTLIMLESPSSHAFGICNIRKITQLAKQYGIQTYIDNTYCTPIFQNPMDMGVDIVMHTATKYLGGHSDLMGGALVVRDKELYKRLRSLRDWHGSIIGPMEAWLVLRGMRTLKIRMEQYCKTAGIIAEFLENHPKVKQVNYPGLPSHPQYELMKSQQTGNGGLMSFSIDGDKDMAKGLVNHLKLFKIGFSWGGYESLAEMPFYNASQEELELVDLPRNLIRIYCGLEGSDNLCEDLSNALKVI